MTMGQGIQICGFLKSQKFAITELVKRKFTDYDFMGTRFKKCD